MKFIILLLIFIILILLDKGLTAISMVEANKHFTEAMKGDYYKIERNPLAKWFYEKLELFWGSTVYALISLVTLFISYFILAWGLSSFTDQQSADRIALWVIFILYGFVILNNTYFLLKYSKVIS